MSRLISIVLLLGVAAPGDAQSSGLRRRLASPAGRSHAIREAVSAGEQVVPALLVWGTQSARNPKDRELLLAIVEVLAAIRRPESIPFLASVILMSSTIDGNHWMKTREAIQVRLPATAALIKIGAPASRFLIDLYPFVEDEEERLAIVFVVSTVADNEARRFLEGVVKEGRGLERFYAQEALQDVGGRTK